jgi:hypothetical protein
MQWGLLSRNRGFGRLWLGGSVSAMGSQVTMLALPLLAVNELGASAANLARASSPPALRSQRSAAPDSAACS